MYNYFHQKNNIALASSQLWVQLELGFLHIIVIETFKRKDVD